MVIVILVDHAEGRDCLFGFSLVLWRYLLIRPRHRFPRGKQLESCVDPDRRIRQLAAEFAAIWSQISQLAYVLRWKPAYFGMALKCHLRPPRVRTKVSLTMCYGRLACKKDYPS